ncbi:MBL fold metallo-hydrolase [Natronorubrum sp. JWXQ-INN-674]|uniref:MBL fold metallo-hydrolase n=1 Tax=Natronorubrum halalkaliphilum TaxID=2691917 RepID=A0A6B0VRB7_9EURY|nr:MBL fold metallo-hydrolase [Natronorubrum halalkaliphilum]MXV63039.1 MBL fold metallo-hydrolase [Natronorubrum halalkaliphilum]
MTERDLDIERVPGTTDVYRVDGRLFDQPGQLAVYVLDAPKPAVIDTGTADTTPDAILGALDELGIARDALAHLIPTHVHLDHAGGTGELASACPNATVHCHERGVDFLTDPELLAKLKRSVEDAIGMPEPYGDPELVPAGRTRSIADGDAIDLGDRLLEVIDAPGHAPHQACLFDETTGTLFAADAAGMHFGGEIYPTTQPPSFDLEDAVETVRKLRALDPETICYPHYGVATDATVRLETYEHLLPKWVDAVERVAQTTDDPTEMANELRAEWGSVGLEGDVAGVLQYLEDS